MSIVGFNLHVRDCALCVCVCVCVFLSMFVYVLCVMGFMARGQH